MKHTVFCLFLLAVLAVSAFGQPFSVTPQDRGVEPVVLTGKQFPTWSAGPDPTFREPSTPHNYDTGDVEQYLPAVLQSDCYRKGGQYPNPYDPNDNGDHSCYQSSRLPRNPRVGAPVGRILGYHYRGQGFEQIPLQVDERFTRYLTNNASGFAFYSGMDAENTYAFDREGFRYTSDASQQPGGGSSCLARPAPGSTIIDGKATTPDPVVGLDDDDEIVFLWSDAGPQAPPGTALPEGIESSYEIRIVDPTNPTNLRYAYVMLAAESGPRPAFDATNGYVQYARDSNADLFVYSQSSYGSYGAAPKGPYCTPDGQPSTAHGAIAQRRPLDTAWVKTARYWFRYDGRWLMDALHVSPSPAGTGLTSTEPPGPDLIDQWKARAFQQRPGGETPCCGYEEEVNNWGGSSILLGERVGPVRAIRATWGADSSTNNVRIETFYRDEIRFGDALRVHVVPPLDGIYVQWDFNPLAINRYYNPWRPEGVAVDGQNDEVFGNLFVHAALDKVEVRDGDPVPVTGPLSVTVPLGLGTNCEIGGQKSICNDIDVHDPTFSGPVGTLNWEEVAGPTGTLVTRWTIKEHTAGDAYSLIAMPYYRDDSCFDDGTGNTPGPHLRGRSIDSGPARADHGETYEGDAAMYFDPVTQQWKPRECWKPEDGDPANLVTNPAGPRRFWQGSIGTQGLHIQLIADSDNAMMPVPVDEIVSEQRMVVLPGNQGNVGERYGRGTEYPLAVIAVPWVAAPLP